MKKLHEELTCTVCETAFIGRKSSNIEGDICPSCLTNNELPEILEGDEIPAEVIAETTDQKEG